MKNKAQTILEFSFCMIILMLLIYAAIMILRWTGLDLALRRNAHDQKLDSVIDEDWGRCSNIVNGTCVEQVPFSKGPISQIDPFYYKPVKLNAVWSGD